MTENQNIDENVSFGDVLDFREEIDRIEKADINKRNYREFVNHINSIIVGIDLASREKDDLVKEKQIIIDKERKIISDQKDLLNTFTYKHALKYKDIINILYSKIIFKDYLIRSLDAAVKKAVGIIDELRDVGENLVKIQAELGYEKKYNEFLKNEKDKLENSLNDVRKKYEELLTNPKGEKAEQIPIFTPKEIILSPSVPNTLSGMNKRIFDLHESGMSNSSIAKELGISPQTVWTKLKKIKENV